MQLASRNASPRNGFLPLAGRMALLLPLAVGAGCSPNWQKPKYDVEDKKILLVPFRDFTMPHMTAPGESPRGGKVIEAFRSWSETNATTNFLEGDDAQNVVRMLREWPTDKPLKAKEWKKLLAGTDADLVLIGEIRELRYTDPKMIAMYKGTIRGRYQLIDTQTGAVAYPSPEITCEFPKGTDLEGPMTEFNAKDKDIEKGLIKEFGQQIAKDLFGYEPESR